MSVEIEQIDLCAKVGAAYDPITDDEKVGISLTVREGLSPINGLRHPPKGDTSGWYIWAGEELSNDPSFFVPLHARHLSEWCRSVEKFLGLPPGWRFLKAGEYEDIWFDPSLLVVD